MEIRVRMPSILLCLLVGLAFVCSEDESCKAGGEDGKVCTGGGSFLSPVELIAKKRDDKELTGEEITRFITGFHNGRVPDYQMSAMLMAIYIRGMTEAETSYLTKAIFESGEMLDLSSLGLTVDKHSTGGVGDKVSIALAPLVASLGIVVPMMSGRGLGHTGGTLDKLESVPGLRTDLTTEEFIEQLSEIGVAITGPTDTVAPVDRSLYALRDVTGTTSSLPLIVSSIMSKKLAEGAAALLLDCKTGSGAFLKNLDESIELAKLLVAAGHATGRHTLAVLTNNDQPIGRAVGNLVELVEAAEVLEGRGPADLRELVRVQCALMLQLGGRVSLAMALAECDGNIANGKGREMLGRLVVRQGGKQGILEKMVSGGEWGGEWGSSKHVVPVIAQVEGYVSRIDSDEIGWSCVALGGGRLTASSVIDHKAAIILHAKVGDFVPDGGMLATVFTDVADHSDIVERVRGAYELQVAPKGRASDRLIRGVIGPGWSADWGEFLERDGLAFDWANSQSRNERRVQNLTRI